MESIEEKIRTLKNKQTVALSAITKKRNELSRIMTSEDMLHIVKSGSDDLNQLCIDYDDAYAAHCNALTSSDDPDKDVKLDQEYRRYNDRQTGVLEYKTHVRSWIAEAENAVSDELCNRSTVGTIRSKSSIRSHSSSRSSTISAKSEERAKIAELLAEKAMLHRKQQLQAQTEELKLDTEIAKARAREQVYANEQLELKQLNSADRISNSSVVFQTSVPTPAIDSMSSNMTDTTTSQLNAPNVDIPTSTSNTELFATICTIPDISGSGSQPIIKDIGCSNMMQSISTEAPPTASSRFPLWTAASISPLSLPVTTSVTTPLVTSRIGHDMSNVNFRSKGSTSEAMNPAAMVFQTPCSGMNSSPHLISDSVDVRHRCIASPQDTTELLIQTQYQLATALTLPHPEVPKFRGESMDYNNFIMAFDARITSRVKSNSDKLYYLYQHLEGEPQDLIGGCLYIHPDHGYAEARSLLHRTYGDPYKISMAYLHKVLSWPFVKNDDCAGLKRLCFFLIKCNNVMKSIEHLDVLNHSPNMQAIVQKLPSYLQIKWCDKVMKLQKRELRIANFGDLVNFVELATEVANNPIYSKEALKSANQQIVSSNNDRNHMVRATSFVTDVYTRSSSVGDNIHKTPCPLCKRTHSLGDCTEFIAKTVEDKRAFMMENKLCFSCYGYDHISKFCTNKHICKKCGKRHPSALHIDNFMLNRRESSI